MRSLILALLALIFVPSAEALEPNEVFGVWQDNAMRVELSQDEIVMGFGAPGYSEGEERATVTYQAYSDGLLIRTSDGSGVLVRLQSPDQLSLVFPGAAAALLTRVPPSQ